MTPTTFEPGEVTMIQLPLNSPAREAVLRDESHAVTRAPIEHGRAQIHLPDKPGLYALTYDDSNQVQKVFSVNPSPKESELVYAQSPEVMKTWQINRPTEPPDINGQHQSNSHLATTASGGGWCSEASQPLLLETLWPKRENYRLRMQFRFTTVETSLNRAEFRVEMAPVSPAHVCAWDRSAC